MTIDRISDRITQAIALLMERGVLPTDLSTVELEAVDAELRRQTFFSARTTSASYLEELQQLVGRYLAGGYENDRPQLRIEARALLARLSYTPERGFPGDAARGIPPAAPGSLRDLSSEARLNLILETQRQLAGGLGLKIRGARRADAFPAWELVRVESRAVPRGSDGESLGWQTRWFRAGLAPVRDASGRPRLIAAKDDPGWARLGSRELFPDALDTDHPPFAFRSGMAWREVDAEEWAALQPPAPPRQERTPARRSASLPPSVAKLSPDIQEAFLTRLDAVPEGTQLSLEQLRAIKRGLLRNRSLVNGRGGRLGSGGKPRNYHESAKKGWETRRRNGWRPVAKQGQGGKPFIGKTGDWQSLGLPPLERLQGLHSRARRIDNEDAFDILHKGFTVTDPIGNQVRFNAATEDHMREKVAAGDTRRPTFLGRANQTVRQPCEIWKTGMRFRYLSMFVTPKGKRHILVVTKQISDTGSYTVTYTPKEKNGARAIRQGTLLFTSW